MAETILLVDDEDALRSLSSEILESVGYAVKQASQGQEALVIYETEGKSIDLVVLDLAMPVMGGRETFRKLMAINPGLKVVVTTGSADDAETRELLALGVKAVLPKPYAVEQFTSVIKNVLEDNVR
jgi:CheY-like chemotaxis protein